MLPRLPDPEPVPATGRPTRCRRTRAQVTRAASRLTAIAALATVPLLTVTACSAPSDAAPPAAPTTRAPVPPKPPSTTSRPPVRPKPPTSTKPPNPKPDTPVTPDPASAGYSFAGVARTPDGRAVPGLTIEFKSVQPCTSFDGICRQPHTTTDSAGRYRITLPAGSYTVLCVLDLQHPPAGVSDCGPRGGDGGPYLVDVPPSGQRLDFVACRTAKEWPRCLKT